LARLNHADNARVITTGIPRQNPEKIAETSSGEVSPRNFRGFHTVCMNFVVPPAIQSSQNRLSILSNSAIGARGQNVLYTCGWQ
jgi:hypothetical protein